MSFHDLNLNAEQAGGQGGGGAVVSRAEAMGRGGGDGLQLLSSSLQKYNASANALKQFVVNSIKPGRTPRSDLDAKVRLCRDCESNVKVQLASQVKKLSAEPKNTVAQKRLAVSKLQKDYERVRQVVEGLVKTSEAKMIAGPGEGGAGEAGSSGGARYGNMKNGSAGEGRTVSNSSDGPRVLQKLQGHEVDEAIAQERERDILKINEDLKLVNEMFKDVAQLVEEQNPAIEQIVEATEESHVRAQAGLEQVQQAAKHQAGCVIS
jgi:hypothetical protein